MDRKKILRRVAVACGAVLLVCTAVSTYVYDALLPRIEVYDFLVRDTPDPQRLRRRVVGAGILHPEPRRERPG